MESRTREDKRERSKLGEVNNVTCHREALIKLKGVLYISLEVLSRTIRVAGTDTKIPWLELYFNPQWVTELREGRDEKVGNQSHGDGLGLQKEVIRANPGHWIERDCGSRMYQVEGCDVWGRGWRLKGPRDFNLIWVTRLRSHQQRQSWGKATGSFVGREKKGEMSHALDMLIWGMCGDV